MSIDYWRSRKVALLGGASLIGTHLADALIDQDVKDLRIVDNLFSGKLGNVKHLVSQGVEFKQWDLREYRAALRSVHDVDVVFHLASQHGGRGYVSSHSTNLWNNLELDTAIYRACADVSIEKVVFSSSACVYPVWMQRDIDMELRLSEFLVDKDDLGFADGPYGTEKLISELMLEDYIKAQLFAGVSTRSYTVYGPLMGETHAICAFIARTMIRQDPFEVWGKPKSIIRNWTYVKDNVAGALLAAEHMTFGAINIGIEDKLFPEDALEIIWDYVGWRPERIAYKGDKPTGPVNRVADATKLKRLGWEPKFTFKEGLHKTINWYYKTHKEEEVRDNLERKLTEI